MPSEVGEARTQPDGGRLGSSGRIQPFFYKSEILESPGERREERVAMQHPVDQIALTSRGARPPWPARPQANNPGRRNHPLRQLFRQIARS